MRGLVIEDEELAFRAIARFLRLEDWHVEGAANVAETRAKLVDSFDAFFVDLKLGKESGLDVLRLVTALPVARAIVIVSGHTSKEEAVRAAQRFEVPFLAKPFGPDQLWDTLRRALAIAALLRELGLARMHAINARAEIEKLVVEMRAARGNQSDAARRLAVARPTLRRALERYDLLGRFAWLWQG